MILRTEPNPERFLMLNSKKVVKNEKILDEEKKNYLNDLFSNKFIEDNQKEIDLELETINQQKNKNL